MAGAKCRAMRTAASLFFIAALLYMSSAGAQEATGRVRAIYYEAKSGILVDGKMLRTPSARRWADVQLESGRMVLVRAPSDMAVSIGDVVAMELETPRPTGLAAITVVEPMTGEVTHCALKGTCTTVEVMRRESRITAIRPQTQIATPGEASAGR
jgi:hypothetical protein